MFSLGVCVGVCCLFGGRIWVGLFGFVFGCVCVCVGLVCVIRFCIRCTGWVNAGVLTWFMVDFRCDWFGIFIIRSLVWVCWYLLWLAVFACDALLFGLAVWISCF